MTIKKLCGTRISIKTSNRSWFKNKKIHRVLKFKQNAWLKPYIEMSNKHRMNTKSNFKKDIFNLTNNSVFGKTMENIRNHRDIKLVTTKEKLIKHAREPNLMNIKCFREDLLAVEMRKTEIK